MYISRVIINNYGFLNHIDFSLFPKTIIYGENASGKTTFLSAIY